MSDCNSDTLKIIDGAYVDRSVAGAKIYEKFQFERIGFFYVDPDAAKAPNLIFNRTVLLKEDSAKNAP